MTLNEAIKRKKEIGRYLTSDKGVRYHTLILPEEESDRSTYLHWCKTNMIYTDKTLSEAEKPFSKNGQYRVFGIQFNDKVVTDIVIPLDLD